MTAPEPFHGVEDAAFRAGYAHGMGEAAQNLKAALDSVEGLIMRASRVKRMLQALAHNNYRMAQHMRERKGAVYTPPAKDRGFV